MSTISTASFKRVSQYNRFELGAKGRTQRSCKYAFRLFTINFKTNSRKPAATVAVAVLS